MIRILSGFCMLSLLVSCASIQVKSPEVHRIIMTKNPAPKGCKFLGNVIGSQGNFFTGGWTSNKNLAEGAMNDLKNKAYDLGGNYVQLEHHQAGVTGSGSSYNGTGSSSLQQTDVTETGTVYRCDPKEIGLE